MPERNVTREEFRMYADQQNRIMDALKELLTTGVENITSRQDETNSQLRKLNGIQAEHSKVIIDLNSQSRTAFFRIGELQTAIGVVPVVEAQHRAGSTHILKKKETYIGGAAFVGLVELLKEIVPAIIKTMGWGG